MAALLEDDPHGWFPVGQRVPAFPQQKNKGASSVKTLSHSQRSIRPDISAGNGAACTEHAASNTSWPFAAISLNMLKHGDVPRNEGDMTTVCNPEPTPLARHLRRPAIAASPNWR